MDKFEQIFYRNNRSLSFKVVDTVSEIESFLPTIVLYADNGSYVYQPYIFRKVQYVHNLQEIADIADMYFVLRHDVYNSDKLDITMRLIETDLKSGDYFPFGELDDNPFKEF